MALKVTLKPGEKFVINGAVVVNGDRRTNLVIQNRVSILREKDIMLPQNADTPVKRIYFAIMMMYLDGKHDRKFYEDFVQRTSELMNAIRNQDALQNCLRIIEDVHDGNYYKALITCKKLLPFEKERLDYATPGL